ncbi:MAG: recombinase family protein [Phototrophicaceae bacterium]
MKNDKTFKQIESAFEEVANDNYLGDPYGRNAYVYIRVSTEEQSDNQRSGLARQVINCHKIAKEKGYRVSWDWIYSDHSSGFRFDDRDGLSSLRNQITSSNRVADIVIIEMIDRLSRNADWHQGYLLDEFKRQGVEVVFWKSFSSRIERAVMGAVAQDAMELSKKRMYDGSRAKAKSGRVTARKAAYGYKLVDSNGNEGHLARKDTHYGIDEKQAQVVQNIYSDLVSGKPLRTIARELSGLYPSPSGKANWGASTIRAIISNPNYKGEFHAFRWSKDKNGRHIEYDEYIIVPVPQIVSEALWDAANNMLQKNKQTASRNAKQKYLLTGLVKCAECGYAYVGHKTNKRSGKTNSVRKTPLLTYQCSSRQDYRNKHEIHCSQGKIGSKKLEKAIWHTICKVLLEPTLLTEALKNYFSDDKNEDIAKQIIYLNEQLLAKQREDERLYLAYVAGAFDENEFTSHRAKIKEIASNLETEISTLNSQVMTPEQADTYKQNILKFIEQFQNVDLLEEVPFDKKRRIIKMVVDRIELSQNKRWFKMKGAISGVYPISNVLTETREPPNDSNETPSDLTDEVSANLKNTSIVYNSAPILVLLEVRHDFSY